MKILKFFSISLLMLMLGIQTGCTQQNELGTLSVVTGFFLDCSQNSYNLLADCLEFSGQTQNGSFQTKKISVSGSTLNEAFQKLETQSQTPLYFSRAKVFLMKNPKKEELQALFDMKMLPADIFILQTDLTEKTFLEKENSFAVELDTQLKKTEGFHTCKLYQLIKTPNAPLEIPHVFVSENGFYLRHPEHSKQKEGGL